MFASMLTAARSNFKWPSKFFRLSSLSLYVGASTQLNGVTGSPRIGGVLILGSDLYALLWKLSSAIWADCRYEVHATIGETLGILMFSNHDIAQILPSLRVFRDQNFKNERANCVAEVFRPVALLPRIIDFSQDRLTALDTIM